MFSQSSLHYDRGAHINLATITKTPVRAITKTGPTPFDIQHLHPSSGAAWQMLSWLEQLWLKQHKQKSNWVETSCWMILPWLESHWLSYNNWRHPDWSHHDWSYPNWIGPANQNPLTGGCHPGATQIDQIEPTGASLTKACKKYSSQGGAIKGCSSWVT